MSSKWAKALDVGRQTLIVAVDIEGAFDRVWHKGLIAKMESVGIGGNLLELLTNYLGKRSFHVDVGGFRSEEHPVMAGVPQGSVLGPLMWVIFSNDCLNMFPEADAFADDVTLSVSCDPSQLKTALRDFNRRLNLLSK